MARAFERFIAARYLRAPRRTAVISLVTVLSILGIAAGVAALVIALAINNGFRNTLQSNLLGATPHVMLMEKEPGPGIAGWRELAARLKTLPHVVDAAPALYGQAFAAGPIQASGALLKGVLPQSVASAEIAKHLVSGSMRDIEPTSGIPGILLGSALARRIGMVQGAIVNVTTPQGEITPAGTRPLTLRFRVTGIFETGFFDIDNQVALTHLASAQKAFGLSDVVNSVELRVDDINLAPQVAAQAQALAPKELAATHWMEQNRQLLGALRMERTVSVITIGLIQLVAALNILVALVMIVMEKRRGIAILLSMGATRAQIRRIFVLQGLFIGAIGAGLGLIAGYTLCYLADRYRWISLDADIYSLSYVPFQPRLIDAFWVAGIALLVSFLATLHPSASATRISPVETLRYE